MMDMKENYTEMKNCLSTAKARKSFVTESEKQLYRFMWRL